MSRESEKKKRKKKQESEFESYLLAVLQKSAKDVMNQAFQEIFKDIDAGSKNINMKL